MDFRTKVELSTGLPSIHHVDRILLMGSCFAENMGLLLAKNKFRVDMNPFGILYNPLSVSTALAEIIEGKTYRENDLFLYKGLWHSSMHHGSFSSSSIEKVLENINIRLRESHRSIHEQDWLILTFGTAYVYEQKENKCIVSNCHKQPEDNFSRRLLSVTEIVNKYIPLISEMVAHNAKLKVLFTVSPIRHKRDGMHANQLSKSTLLLAIEHLQHFFPEHVFYFPSYEIVLDELRDYRFYADDMLHPSGMAISYIWDRFSDAFFSNETKLLLTTLEEINKDVAHKPFHPESETYQRFLGQIVLKIERLNRKYPYLDFQKEIELCHIRLNR